MSSLPVLSSEELLRYSRHIILPDFKLEGQLKLKAASVLVVGSGGLGSPVLQYLTAAGVGHIGIVDFDKVDKSNLQRQVLFSIDDIGRPKAEVARDKLKRLNPHVHFTTYNLQLNSENALEIIRDYGLVIDGTDNFPSRYLINDACTILGKPLIYGSIFKYEGQVSVFNLKNPDGTRSPNYRDLFPTPPPPDLVPSCSESGVLGVLPGIIGSIQANEAIKVICGLGDTLAGKLFIFDTKSFQTMVLKFSKSKNSPKIEKLIDYEAFCDVSPAPYDPHEISAQELATLLGNGDPNLELIDVREPYEYEIANLGGKLIPLNELENRKDEISPTKKTVFICRSGKRSGQAVNILQKLGTYPNLYFLKGGILSWSKQIDPSLPEY